MSCLSGSFAFSAGWSHRSSKRSHPAVREVTQTVRRVCFQLQVKPHLLAEYRERHDSVWPEMKDALRQAGWHNYSLFVRTDGLLIGYFETSSMEAALAAMQNTAVNARWQADMAGFFEGLDDKGPDERFLVLDEVFHLEDPTDLADDGEVDPT